MREVLKKIKNFWTKISSKSDEKSDKKNRSNPLAIKVNDPEGKEYEKIVTEIRKGISASIAWFRFPTHLIKNADEFYQALKTYEETPYLLTEEQMHKYVENAIVASIFIKTVHNLLYKMNLIEKNIEDKLSDNFAHFFLITGDFHPLANFLHLINFKNFLEENFENFHKQLSKDQIKYYCKLLLVPDINFEIFKELKTYIQPHFKDKNRIIQIPEKIPGGLFYTAYTVLTNVFVPFYQNDYYNYAKSDPTKPPHEFLKKEEEAFIELLIRSNLKRYADYLAKLFDLKPDEKEPFAIYTIEDLFFLATYFDVMNREVVKILRNYPNEYQEKVIKNFHHLPDKPGIHNAPHWYRVALINRIVKYAFESLSEKFKDYIEITEGKLQPSLLLLIATKHDLETPIEFQDTFLKPTNHEIGPKDPIILPFPEIYPTTCKIKTLTLNKYLFFDEEFSRNMFFFTPYNFPFEKFDQIELIRFFCFLEETIQALIRVANPLFCPVHKNEDESLYYTPAEKIVVSQVFNDYHLLRLFIALGSTNMLELKEPLCFGSPDSYNQLNHSYYTYVDPRCPSMKIFTEEFKKLFIKKEEPLPQHRNNVDLFRYFLYRVVIKSHPELKKKADIAFSKTETNELETLALETLRKDIATNAALKLGVNPQTFELFMRKFGSFVWDNLQRNPEEKTYLHSPQTQKIKNLWKDFMDFISTRPSSFIESFISQPFPFYQNTRIVDGDKYILKIINDCKTRTLEPQKENQFQNQHYLTRSNT